MKGWFAVYSDDKRIVLEVFPYQPGGCTVYLPPSEALDLARRLREAAEEHLKKL